MRIGLLIERFDWPGGPAATRGTLLRIARDAEAAGVASIWVNDHLFQIPTVGEAGDPVLEAYTTLSFLAAATERVELGTLTTGAHYRHPGLLLKMVASLDVVSGGRAWLGVGPAWNEREQRGLGIPVPSWPERFARLEELLRLTHRLWDGDERPFHGEHYRLEEPLLRPAPLRRPPILVGGAKERRLYPLVARYADACNLFEGDGDAGLAMLRLKLRMLAERCAAAGRDVDALVRTTYGHLALSRSGGGGAETVASAVERFQRLSEEGIDMAIVSSAELVEPSGFELLAEVIRAMAPPAGRQAISTGQAISTEGRR